MRYAVAKLLMGLARRLSDRAWAEASFVTANRVSVAVLMSSLDRMAVPHCSECPQTRGIVVFAGRAYCNRHVPANDLDAWLVK